MRLSNWTGTVALACAAAGGYVAGEASHRHDPVVIQVCDANGLPDEPHAVIVEGTPLAPPRPVEEIDLTCPGVLPAGLASESIEPPLADPPATGPFRLASFELPAAAPADPDLPRMPYITDDPAPTVLPPLGDVPPLTPNETRAPNPANPIYLAAKKFVTQAMELPEDPKPQPEPEPGQSEDWRTARAEWRRIWLNDPPSTLTPAIVTVPLGTPPNSIHPSALPPAPAVTWNGSEPPKHAADRAPQQVVPLVPSDTKPRPKVDTMEVRPGDVPPKSDSDLF